MYSRNEQYLEACCNKSGTDELPKPVSRNETLLYRLAEELSKGSGLPTGDTPYQQLVTDSEGNAKWEDRLAYETEPVLTEILPEHNFTGTNQILIGGSKLSIGQTYTVKFDNTEYECICVDLGGVPAIGNASIMRFGSDTGEPFLLGYMHGAFIAFVIDETNTHTVSVSGFVTPIVKIPAKFIDKNSSGYIVIHSSNTMTQQEAETYSDEISTNEVVFIIWGGMCISSIGFGGTTGYDLQLATQNGENYCITKNADGLFAFSDRKLSNAFLPNGVEMGDDVARINVSGKKIRILPGAIYSDVGSTDALFQVQSNGTKSKDFSVLGNGEAVTQALILYSSTADSTKRFRITVDDTGELSTTDGDGNSVSISDLIDAKLGVIENGTY